MADATAPRAFPTAPRVAIVHDWLTGMRGGEKVLEAICRLFPAAPIHTLVHARGSVSAAIEARAIQASPLLRLLPARTRLYRHYLPLFPAAIETLDLDRADLVISTSHCAAKAVIAPGRARHLCYCHSPMRYAWDQYEAYFGPDRVGRLGSQALRPVLAWLARWDRSTTHRVDRFLANSQHVAGRIGRYYNRGADVVYPPVDTAFFAPSGLPPEPGFLVVSALVPYKRIDVAIAAANRLGVRLRIVGTGPDADRLRRQAGPTVEFAGTLDPVALRAAYQSAEALVLPGEEDFGIAPVESMACGRPVVALARGGARETVIQGETGLLVDSTEAGAFAEAMSRIRARAFSAEACRRRASAFSAERFDAQFRAVVTQTLSAPSTC